MTGFTCQTIRLFLSSISCGYKNIQPFMVALLISFPVRPTTKFNKKKKKKLTQKAQSFSIYKILNSDQYLTNEWTKQIENAWCISLGKERSSSPLNILVLVRSLWKKNTISCLLLQSVYALANPLVIKLTQSKLSLKSLFQFLINSFFNLIIIKQIGYSNV